MRRSAFVGMAIRSYHMPIGSYFLVMGPALAAGLWFMGTALEPARPPQAQTVVQAATPGPVSAPTAASALVTPGRAASQPMTQVQDTTEPAEPSVAEATRSSNPPEATSRSAEVAKHKKRKQTARRRQHRDSTGPTYAQRSPYRAYASRDPYAYAPPQPFFGFRNW